ncbi:MAG: ABC transporter permease subunit [Treponema sp.]|jgi:putative aldouronate transport system permease protein|nr:ABC transporter permease subunit [Treponema sp.]
MQRQRRILYKTLPFHLMLAVPVLFLLIFAYVPMGGIIIAFQNYHPGLGFLRSRWVGLGNFEYIFKLPNFLPVLRNTMYIAFLKIVLNIVIPVGFALLLNEVQSRWFKKAVQTITYLPYFLSWVIFGGILRDFLAPGGPVNNAITSLGGASVYFLGNVQIFPLTMAVTDTWKNFGFNTIVYLAALTGIDPNLYEAAAVDGANRLKQTLHITMPGILPIVSLMTILSIGNILNAGFDQIFNLYSPIVYSTGDIIDTLVYRIGIIDARYSISTAIGLFKSVVSLILITGSYKLADKYAGYRVF